MDFEIKEFASRYNFPHSFFHNKLENWKTQMYVFAKTLPWLKSLNTVRLRSYPAGRCLWFRIFEENQTVSDQHHPRKAPIFPATQTHTYTDQIGFRTWNHTCLQSCKQMQSFFVVVNGRGLVTPHLSFRPPSAIFVLFKRPAFSSSWEHIKGV